MGATATMEKFDGLTLVDHDGDTVGTIESTYKDITTGSPLWLGVKMGHIKHHMAFVPAQGLSLAGDAVQTDFTAQDIESSPRLKVGEDMTYEDEERLTQHYELTSSSPPSADTSESYRGKSFAETQAAAGDYQGQTFEPGGITRSEEQLEVGTQTVEAGTARLEKRVRTEHVQRTVPVTHEEVVVVREPAGRGRRGARIGEEQQEVVLHEEQVTVGKRTVPKESVRLATRQVTEQETVDADLRKEEVKLRNTGRTKTKAAAKPATRSAKK